jgi:hypothetical protein
VSLAFRSSIWTCVYYIYSFKRVSASIYLALTYRLTFFDMCTQLIRAFGRSNEPFDERLIYAFNLLSLRSLGGYCYGKYGRAWRCVIHLSERFDSGRLTPRVNDVLLSSAKLAQAHHPALIGTAVLLVYLGCFIVDDFECLLSAKLVQFSIRRWLPGP